mgnify:FL=1
MTTQNINRSKPLLLKYDNVAYLVDYKNVELYRQYIEKYYNEQELIWFDDLILAGTRKNKHQKFILYFSSRGFSYDYNHKTILAYADNFTIYYVTNTLMIVE